MSERTRIDIAICTFRRQHIVNTLASVAELAIPYGYAIHVIVADNDETPSAQVTVVDAAARFGLELTYLHAPAKNISIARNACLNAARGDYLAFIDDDELVEKHWLENLLAVAREMLVEIVLGPVMAVYPAGTPRWMIRGDFHSTRPVWVKGTITTGYCGNVLMKRSDERLIGLRFREDLGITGGEDTDFFSRATAAGARILYAENAFAYEPVSPERASFGWLRQRRLRYGQTHAMTLLAQGHSHGTLQWQARAKMLYCFSVALLLFFDPLARRQWWLRGSLWQGAAAVLKANETP